MRIAHAALVAMAAALAAGCDDDVFTPSNATIEVTVSTIGVDVDVDGYDVVLNGTGRRSVDANDTVAIIVHSAGAYTVSLDRVDSNCTFTGGTTRVVDVSAGATVDVRFDVSCSALANVRVTIETSGPDHDVNGYRLSTTHDGFWREKERVIGSASVIVTRLPIGPHDVMLDDVSPNCEVALGDTRRVNLSSGDTLDVLFEVVCAPATLIAFATGPDSAADIYRIQSNGALFMRLTDYPAPDLDPVWAPDGSRIAFVSERDGNAEIYVMNADGTDQTRLTHDSVPDRAPAWSPDGGRIAFASTRDGNDELYVMNSDGSGLVRLTSDPADDRDPAWSPDGSRIAFVRHRGLTADVHVMSTNGANVARITNIGGEVAHPTWSPDGLRIAFSHTGCTSFSCVATVFVASPDGTVVSPLTSGQHPAWSPDGRTIAHVGLICDYFDFYGYEYDCRLDGVRVIGTDGRNPVELVSGPVSAISWAR